MGPVVVLPLKFEADRTSWGPLSAFPGCAANGVLAACGEGEPDTGGELEGNRVSVFSTIAEDKVELLRVSLGGREVYWPLDDVGGRITIVGAATSDWSEKDLCRPGACIL